MICEWTPSNNVYTGKTETAIYAFAEIPLEVRKALIERTKKATSYDDVITISRNSISGNHQYAPEITSMHFGSKGRMCETVSRIKWRDSDTQQALVYCESDHCIIRPSICNNWAIVYRLAETAGIPPITETVETPTETPSDDLPLLAVQDGPSEYPVDTFETGTGLDPFAPTDWISGPVGACCVPGVPTAPAIPEPAPLWLLLAGVASMAIWKNRK